MKMTFYGMVALALALVMAGCDPSGQGEAPARRAVVKEVAQVASEPCAPAAPQTSVLDVAPQDMRAAVAAAYRLQPDKRFLRAIDEIHAFFVPAEPRAEVLAAYVDAAWRVCYRGEVVGALPELAGYADWQELLSGWAGRLNERYPPRWGATLEVALAQTDPVAHDYSVSAALTAIRGLNARWRDGQRTTADLREAARALTLLSVHKLDLIEVADAVDTRAIAMLTLATRLGGHDMRHEEALLAELLGHRTHALALAQQLPPDDAVRLYVLKDDAGLERVARARAASAEARHLHLLRLSDKGDREGWKRWYFAAVPGLPGLHQLKTAVGLRAFELNAGFAPLLPHITLMAVAAQKEGPGWGVDLVGMLGLDAQRDMRKAAAALRSLLQLDKQTMYARLENDLAELGRDMDGAFMDAATLGAFYRGYFYSALYVSGKHYLNSASAAEAAEKFRASLGQPEGGVAADLARWYANLAASMDGRADMAALQRDLTELTHLGGPPLQRTFRELGERASYGDPQMLVAAKALAARLDDRVPHRRILGSVAYRTLFDLPLTERLYANSAEVGEDPDLLIWHAKFTGNLAALRELMERKHLPLDDRIDIPDHLGRLGASEAEVDTAYLRLTAEQPDNWGVQKEYVDYLEQAKRYRDAREHVQLWLDRNAAKGGFSYMVATTAVARQLYHEGRYKEGLRVIEPVMSNIRSGAAERAARLFDKLGQRDKALALARTVVETHPDFTHGLGLLAGLNWRYGQHAEAAQLIKNWRYRIGPWEWRKDLGAPFVEVFGDDVESGVAAFTELLQAGVSPYDLRELVPPVRKAGHHELAFNMASRLTGSGPGGVEFLLRAYKSMSEWRDEKTALDWLRQRVPPQVLNMASMVVYSESEFDLLWDLIPEPERGEHADAVWLYRAAALLQQPGEQTQRRAAVLAYLASSGGSFYDALSGHLLGQKSEAEVLALATDANKRCEAAYFLGVRAMSENRFHDASDWFRVAAETGLIRMGEYRWAGNQLRAWDRKGKSLSLLQDQHAHRDEAEQELVQ
ncbi:MAG: hypothetical protein HYS20_09605 [Rhodocyclales bacterium]|nr:hypothetical protein [Rhodocyclales bacterium]